MQILDVATEVGQLPVLAHGDRKRAITLDRLDNPPESDRFVLAGGAAMAAHGVLDRTTRDLDYFGGHQRTRFRARSA